MPAETHQQRPADGTKHLLELATLLASPDDREAGPTDELARLGIDDEALRWALWDAVVEEFGERGVAEVGDPDDLDDAETLGDLVDVFATWLGWQRRGSATQAAAQQQ